MRLGQNGERSDVWLICPDTLTQNRRWIDSTLPTMSSPWNSVNLLASRMDRSGNRVARHVNSQRAADRGESKCRIVITRIGDNVFYPKGALTSAWCGMARANAESPRQEASKYAIRDYCGFCGLP
jgi:hypothetical protein